MSEATQTPDTAAALAAIAELEAQEAQEAQEEVADVATTPDCPRCGYSASEQTIKISEEDRREYHRSLMGLRPFTKIFNMWGGDVQIRMTALSGKDTDDLNSKLRSLRAEDPAEILETSIKLKLLLLCESISTTEQDIKIERPADMNNLDIHTAFGEQFDLPEVLIRILSGVFAEFEVLVSALTSEGFDENFYKGGGVN